MSPRRAGGSPPPRPEEPPPAALLAQAAELLTLFGVANDAEDHGSGEEARELRARAIAGLRRLLGEAPGLGRLLPTLAGDLERPAILVVRWVTHVEALERTLGAATTARPEPGERARETTPPRERI